MKAFRNRSSEIELMDDTSLEPHVLDAVLQDVSLANRLLGGNRITRNAVMSMISKKPDKEYTIMDVGCGDGAMLRQLAAICRKKPYRVRFIGLDINESAIALAQQHSKDYPEIAYYAGDILKDNRHGLYADITLCTLTLHHIPSSQIPGFLAGMAKITQRAILINDLQRSSLAYYLFKIFSAIFIKTKIARHDGLVSIKKGFKRNELIAFSRQVPSFYPKVEWKWAFRYLLIMTPANLKNHE